MTPLLHVVDLRGQNSTVTALSSASGTPAYIKHITEIKGITSQVFGRDQYTSQIVRHILISARKLTSFALRIHKQNRKECCSDVRGERRVTS